MSLSAPPPFANLREVNVSVTTYTLQNGDHYGYVLTNNASANTVTVPPHSEVPFIAGTLINVTQMGAGQTTIVAGGGVTIYTPGALAIPAQYNTIALVKLNANEWLMSSV